MIRRMLTAGRAAGRALLGGPVTTYALIGLCCLVFAAGPASGLRPGHGAGDGPTAAQAVHFARWGVVPRELLEGSPDALLTPLTALFVHASWFHLLGNMLFLFVFGRMTEARMGRAGFLLFYLGTGCLALVAYAAAHAGSGQSLVGASGSVSGVLGAFLHLFPRARVTSLFPFLLFLPLRFPAWAVLAFWFSLQWLASLPGTARPDVAHLAHLVGFCLGFLTAWALFRGAARVSSAARATEGDSQP
jgi:membrane associated rhomboid family serine protease